MKKFLVLYMAPTARLDEWMKTDPEVRKAEEEKMQKAWWEWMKAHSKNMIADTAGAGKTKRIDANGVSDVRNEIMLYSTIQAESHEEAAKLFEGHPHFGIPDAWVELMQINPLSGM